VSTRYWGPGQRLCARRLHRAYRRCVDRRETILRNSSLLHLWGAHQCR
jgi:hypothetical protein